MTSKADEGSDGQKKGGRPRSGQLVWRATGWRGRVRVTGADGTTTRKLVDLGTTNKGVARRKLNALIRNLAAGAVDTLQESVPTSATIVDVATFAIEHYEKREKLGVKTWRDEERWFERYIAPHIGKQPLENVECTDITELLLAAVKAGRSPEGVKKIRAECGRLFRAARRARLIAASPVDDAELPRMKERKRARTLLTDAEFVQYATHPHQRPWSARSGNVDFEIKVRAIIARTIGGARTSDENALDWADFDLVQFDRVRMYRPKTDTEDVYVVPAMARPLLREWWEAHGSKTSGPVFPIRRGKRAGQRRGKDTFAERFRRDLLIAKVDRHELHNDTDRTLRTDFHSFRRSFATGLKQAGVGAREAMRLTAHTSFETHQGYVQEHGPIPAPPAAALPSLPANVDNTRPFGHKPCPNSDAEITKTGSGWWDLNSQRPAPKAGPLPG